MKIEELWIVIATRTLDGERGFQLCNSGYYLTALLRHHITKHLNVVICRYNQHVTYYNSKRTEVVGVSYAF